MVNVIKKAIVVSLICLLLLFLPGGEVHGQSPDKAQAGVFVQPVVNPGSVVEVPIEIRNVTGLYALDITMLFDPQVFSAQDADPSQPGVQMALGTFLDPGLVLYNTIDNETGKAHFVMTQYNPSEGKSGNGVLLVVYLKALKQGESTFKISEGKFADRNGVEIPAEFTDSTIKVETGDAPAVTSTSIPVQEFSLLTQIPTAAPTATPTPEPTSTPLPTPTIEGQKAVAETTLDASQGSDQFAGITSQPILFMLRNWWIVLILLLLVLAAAVYLLVTDKSKR